jgi:NAD(P)-dependent dehydrogenase (short-subunit alcohol dehydrogenase family)
MSASLTGRTVLIVRGSGIARATALAVRAAGGAVIVAGRDEKALAAAYDDPGIMADQVDLTDESSIVALAERLAPAHHVVSTASARARGPVGDLAPEAVTRSFQTKVIVANRSSEPIGRYRRGDPMIRYESVSKRYPDGATAGHDLTFEAPSHEITVLVGRSGCGVLTALDTQVADGADPTTVAARWIKEQRPA